MSLPRTKKPLKPRDVVLRRVKFIVLFVILGVMAFLPFKVRHRDLTSEADQAKYGVQSTVTVASAPVVTLKLLLSKPALNGISMQIETNNRANVCQLSMVVDGIIQSRPVDCSSITDSSFVPFVFDEDISRGIHQAEVRWSGTPGNEVAYHLYAGKGAGEYWLLPQTIEHWSAFVSFIVTWVRTSWLSSISYLLCILVILYQILFGRVDYLSQLITASAVLVAIIIISKPYIEFDNDTPSDTQYQAAAQTQLSPHVNTPSPAAASQGTGAPEQSQQSASARSKYSIASIGDSSLHLYHNLQTAFVWISARLDVYFPAHMRYLAIAFCVFWLILTFLFAWFMLGLTGVFAISLLIPFYGGLFTQFPTIFKNVPLIYLGLVYTMLLAALLQPIHWWRKIAGVVFSFLVFLSVFSLHHLFTVIPIFLAAGLFFWIGMHPKAQVKGGPAVKKSEIFYFALMEAAKFAMFWLIKMVITTNFMNVAGMVQSYLTDGSIPHDLGKFASPVSTASDWWQYLRSFFGSNAWDYADYHYTVYYVMVLPFLALSMMGFISVLRSYNKARSWAVFLIVAGLIGIQYFIILSANHLDVSVANLVTDSYLKTRLTATGIAGLLLMFFMGLLWSQNTPKLRIVLSYLSKLWCLVLMCYYFPLFFIVDAF